MASMQAGVKGDQPGHHNVEKQEEKVTKGAPELKLASVELKPSGTGPKCGKWTISQLRQSDCYIGAQYGSNQFDSQKRMTDMGMPRDVHGPHMHRMWDDNEEKKDDGVLLEFARR